MFRVEGLGFRGWAFRVLGLRAVGVQVFRCLGLRASGLGVWAFRVFRVSGFRGSGRLKGVLVAAGLAL